jgi:hypothetical protein
MKFIINNFKNYINLVFLCLLLFYSVLIINHFINYKEGVENIVIANNNDTNISCNSLNYNNCQLNSNCDWFSKSKLCISKQYCPHLDSNNCKNYNYCMWDSSNNSCSLRT